MKNYFVIFFFLCTGSAAFAQQSGDVQTLRDNFHANAVAVQPDPSQITTETPTALVKPSGTAVMPTPEQISTDTPSAFPKAPAGSVAVQPDASQIVNETPPSLLKQPPVVKPAIKLTR